MIIPPASSGQQETTPSLIEQYKQLSSLEIETAKLRHTTFTAILSVSFIIPGLALQSKIENTPVPIPGFTNTTLHQVVFLLGFLFYLFALFHYAWHHRYAHIYRRRLKEIEVQLGIEIYRLRKRPKLGPMKLHFDWALQMIGIVYAAVTMFYVGLNLFFASIGVVIGAYLLRMLFSMFQGDEPMEA
jgi:hypothetical protein